VQRRCCPRKSHDDRDANIHVKEARLSVKPWRILYTRSTGVAPAKHHRGVRPTVCITRKCIRHNNNIILYYYYFSRANITAAAERGVPRRVSGSEISVDEYRAHRDDDAMANTLPCPEPVPRTRDLRRDPFIIK